jgi:multidrug efflux pump subunit AcrA (membrane-fusion protein)
MTRRKAWTAVAVGAFAIVATIMAFGAARRATSAITSAPTSTAPAVSLATARFGTLVTHVRAQGRVGAPAGSEAKLSFAGSGILVRVDVHVGQSVVPGQPLAELDTSGLAIDAAQARQDAAAAAALYAGGTVPALALASARQRLTAARNRYGVLLRGNGTAQSDATGAQDALRQAEAKVAADQRAVQREQTLFTGGVAAQKDVDAARQQLTLDRADADAARAKLASATSGVGGAIVQARAELAQAESEPPCRAGADDGDRRAGRLSARALRCGAAELAGYAKITNGINDTASIQGVLDAAEGLDNAVIGTRGRASSTARRTRSRLPPQRIRHAWSIHGGTGVPATQNSHFPFLGRVPSPALY